TGEWSAVYLWRNGIRDKVNCAAFPATMNALCSLDNAAFRNVSYEGLEEPGCAFASAYLSKLTPGTLVTPHCGPCNARLRVHLALRIPKDDSRVVRWEEGRCVLFDDSFVHSADKKRRDADRIVLVLDLWHPALGPGDRNAVRALYPGG
ncbi:predicted protein, partial [Micromonas commoda]